MKRSTHLLASLCAACAVSSVAYAEPSYRLTLITTPDANGQSQHVGVLGMNDRGELTGVIEDNTTGHAYVWKQGEFTIITDPDIASRTTGYGINNRGEVVGIYTPVAHTGAHERAFAWRQGEMIDLGSVFPGAIDVNAYAINDRGQAVGASYTFGEDGQAYPFVWQRGKLRAVELSGGWAINNQSVIAGVVMAGSHLHAATWRDGEIVDLGVLPDALSSIANGINDRGHVVGYSTAHNGGQRAFIWRHGTMSELPPLNGDDRGNTALSINNRDQVVGATFTTAIFWEHGVAYDLNRLIAPDDPLIGVVRLDLARLINNRGQIVVNGKDFRLPAPSSATYLLTPTRSAD